MLSPADDFLLHQTPDTFDRVFTSDRNFYDRYYFNMHPCSDELFLIAGLGQYPNLGVTDAFVTVSCGDTQYTVRSSRELGADRLNTSVGPLGVEVLEGLRRFRVWCDPNEWGVDFDLTWDGSVPAMEEAPFFARSFGRVMTQGSRITQTGFWTGKLHVAGNEYDVSPDHWWGIRDHSWGIRSVGEPEHPGIRSKLVAGEGGLHTWVPMQFDDYTIHFFVGEDADGRRGGNMSGMTEEARRAYAFGSPREGEIEHLGTPHHNVRFKPGTREMKTATVTFDHPSGKEIAVECTALRTVHLMAGTGYGGSDGWRHGAYQGELKTEGLTYDLKNPAVIKSITGLNETLSRFEVDGKIGYGMYEHAIRGIYRPYGFNSAADVAP